MQNKGSSYSFCSNPSSILLPAYSIATTILIATGKNGQTLTEAANVMEVVANLLVEKVKTTKSKNVKVYFYYLPGENHTTMMHQAFFKALKILHPSSITSK